MKNVIYLLKKQYGRQLKSTLEFSNAWELLVATMLSAQAQDKQVNIVTKRLFKDYKTISDYAMLKPLQLYKYTKSIGLYRNKSKNIILAARKIKKDFNGKVPDTMEGLISLPGIGRKTANVVIYNWFGKNLGIAIDTHCITVLNRLGMTKSKNAEKIEKEIMQITDKKEWGNLTHLLIALGRDVCTARAKHCEACVLNKICPSSTVKK
ncbi:MAG: endonuclease III [Methanothrix sp.]